MIAGRDARKRIGSAKLARGERGYWQAWPTRRAAPFASETVALHAIYCQA